MWYFRNLKESFLEIFAFTRSAQPMINSGLVPWFCYVVSFLICVGVFIACTFGFDFYYHSPKKEAILNDLINKKVEK